MHSLAEIIRTTPYVCTAGVFKVERTGWVFSCTDVVSFQILRCNLTRVCNKEEDMKSWQCVICQYVYDPAVGDDEHGIAPGTAFEELPDDWVCPLCGAGKDSFEQI